MKVTCLVKSQSGLDPLNYFFRIYLRIFDIYIHCFLHIVDFIAQLIYFSNGLLFYASLI